MMLTVKNVQKQIDDEQVLNQISFSIEKGSIVGLVGRNGVGKTTLLKSIVGILDIDDGEISFDGKNVFSNPEVKKEIVFIQDSHTTFNHYNVKEIVHLYEAIYPLFDRTYFYELLERFKLPTNRKIRSFSRGMKSLLFITVAICTKARLIILDEPTNGLDIIVKKKILQLLLEEVSEQNFSILISSHHLDELEKISDTILMMKSGAIGDVITMEDTKNRYKKFQIVFQDNFPESIKVLPHIKIINQVGRVNTIIIEDKIEDTVKMLKSKKPLLLEELPMTLEDLFLLSLGGDDIAY
jgi:ABC-2 type transport system ATP-binding protein